MNTLKETWGSLKINSCNQTLTIKTTGRVSFNCVNKQNEFLLQTEIIELKILDGNKDIFSGKLKIVDTGEERQFAYFKPTAGKTESGTIAKGKIDVTTLTPSAIAELKEYGKPLIEEAQKGALEKKVTFCIIVGDKSYTPKEMLQQFEQNTPVALRRLLNYSEQKFI